MKKWIGLTLAAAMVLTMAACGKDKEPEEPLVTIPPMTEAPLLTEAPEYADEIETLETESTFPGDLEAIETVPMETAEEPTEEPAPQYEIPEDFNALDDTVYAKRKVNVRQKPNVNSKKMGELQKGESVRRLGRSKNNQWSAVVFQDELCFIATEYLSVQEVQGGGGGGSLQVTESASSGTVYTTSVVRLRQGPGQDTYMLDSLPKDAALQRLAICSNGWVKVSYNGVVGYVAGGYLTEKAPEKPAEKPETKPEDTQKPGSGTVTPGGSGTPTPGGSGTVTPGGSGTPTPGGSGTPTPGGSGTPTPGGNKPGSGTVTPGGDNKPGSGTVTPEKPGSGTVTPGEDQTPGSGTPAKTAE